MPGTDKSFFRRFERVPKSVPIQLLLKSPSGEISRQAQTMDVSVHGLRIKAEQNLAPSQEIFVPYFGPCRVAWVRYHESGEFAEAGLEICDRPRGVPGNLGVDVPKAA